MKEFVRWLLETGHEVRLLIGDHDDEPEGPRDPCRPDLAQVSVQRFGGRWRRVPRGCRRVGVVRR
jgi:hypothetical protein